MEHAMKDKNSLEFQYAKRLRECPRSERSALYREAYTAVSDLAVKEFASDRPEDRTAGTSERRITLLSKVARKTDRVLEIGCGRGYSCLKLSPHVASIVGTDVSTSSLDESRRVLVAHGIENVEIRELSAFELTGAFTAGAFSLCFSIDVIEHLHPEDCREHFRQVHELLEPGGRYVIITPNRVNGPHDVTAEEFPDAREPIGFHLNETTYAELSRELKASGFTRLQALWGLPGRSVLPIRVPSQVGVLAESVYAACRKISWKPRALDRFLSISIVACKPAVGHAAGGEAASVRPMRSSP
jgi:SAM-dependent methyltransferase